MADFSQKSDSQICIEYGPSEAEVADALDGVTRVGSC